MARFPLSLTFIGLGAWTVLPILGEDLKNKHTVDPGSAPSSPVGLISTPRSGIALANYRLVVVEPPGAAPGSCKLIFRRLSP